MAENNQRRHNKTTKGSNTKKMGALWAIRHLNVKSKDGDSKVVKREVRVPPTAMFDPELLSKKELHEPFDAIKLDWANELASYLAEHPTYKLYKGQLDSGQFEYKIRNEGGDLVFSVISSRNAFLDARPRRRRRRKRKK